MPAPSSRISTDAILYDLIYNPLADQLCFLDPNWVTLTCFAMLAPSHLWAIQEVAAMATISRNVCPPEP